MAKITKNMSKLKNDIVLTISLMISLFVTQMIMSKTGLNLSAAKSSTIIFIFLIVFTKLLYKVLNKLVSYFFRNILKWK